MIFLLKVDIKVPHKSAKFQNFSFNINRVMNFFLFCLYSRTTTKIIIPELTRISSKNKMCERFQAEALLNMCRMSFQSIIAPMGADILEISLEILTFRQQIGNHDHHHDLICARASYRHHAL